MSSISSSDLITSSISNIDHVDRLPDSIILLIFNKISDVKSLGRCSLVSKRFNTLIPQVDNVIIHVDCVISDPTTPLTPTPTPITTSKSPSIFRLLFSNLLKPLQSLSNLISSSPPRDTSDLNISNSDDDDQVTHHSPSQVLKNFNEIKLLKIQLPGGELSIDDGVLLKWKASFGSTLNHCVILGASTISITTNNTDNNNNNNLNVAVVVENENNTNTTNNNNDDDNGSIPESFYTNGGLKLRVVWTISSLIAASARHYLLQSIISEHKTLESLILSDSDGQGVLCMNKEELDELRVKPLSASSASKRTLVPALNMRLWYAPYLELGNGMVLKGATLVAIRPSEMMSVKKEVGMDGCSWVGDAFEEPFRSAARMLVKRKTYCLEMNSF